MKRTFPYRYRVLILLFFLILLTALDRISISLVGVRIKADLGLSNEQFGWVLGAFTLAYALFEIPAGAMADRIGQKKLFIRIVLCWSFFTALTGVTINLTTLIITRFLFGVGEAGAFPTATGAISRWMPAKETSRGTSWLLIGSSAGAAVAPFIVVPIAQAYGWRAPFFVIGGVGLVWVLICWVWFRNDPSGMKGISRTETELIESGRRFKPHKTHFPLKAALKDKNLLSLVLTFFCSQWALYFFLAWMPVYLQQGKHFTEDAMKHTASSLFFIGVGGGFIGGFFIDWLAKRRGLKFARRSVGFTCLAMEGFLFLVAAMARDNQLTSAAIMCAYFFSPINATNAFSTCVDLGGNRASTVAGMTNFAGNLGGFFLTIFFGKLADLTHSFDIPIFLIVAMVFTGSLLWLRIDPTKKIAVAADPLHPQIQFQ